MPNIMDYLDWRGDIPFSVDPFHHVDNLILSELAYIDFAGIVPGAEEDASVSLQEANEAYWRRHSGEESQRERTFFYLAPTLLKKVAAAPRYAGMRLSGYTNTVSAEENEQMSAVTFRLKNGLVYVAFRGTDDTLTGWKEDFYLTFMEETRGQRMAADYLSRARLAPGEILYTGGHSKGGNLAVYAAAFCDEGVRDRVSRVYTNDGPGFLESVLQKPGYQAILPKIVSIIPEESVFGLLLDSGYPSMVIRSSRKGLWQHDAMSWEVMGNRFVEAPSTTKGSALMEKTVDRWISGIPFEERRKCVDTVFNIIEASGKSTVSALQTGGPKAILEMLGSYQSLDNQEKNTIREVFQRLLLVGADVLRQDLSNGKR